MDGCVVLGVGGLRGSDGQVDRTHIPEKRLDMVARGGAERERVNGKRVCCIRARKRPANSPTRAVSS